MARTSQGSISQLERRVTHHDLSLSNTNRPQLAAGAQDHQEGRQKVDAGDDESHYAGVVHIPDQAVYEDVHVLPGGVVQVVVVVDGV